MFYKKFNSNGICEVQSIYRLISEYMVLINLICLLNLPFLFRLSRVCSTHSSHVIEYPPPQCNASGYLIFLFFLGLAGFARLTPGDVFQVIVNHGTQKWKSKGRISSKAQKWDNDYSTIKALVGEVLNIRVGIIALI